MEAVQNRLLYSVVAPQLAQNQKEEGCVSKAVRGTPIIVSLSRLEVAVCQEYSTLLLIVQGLEDYLMQGNCDEGELLWRAEATAGSCASLPGPVDVCAGGIGAG